MDIETENKVNELAAEFIETARGHGVQIENIEVDWIDGKYDAKVGYSRHNPRIPEKDSYHGETQTG